MADLISTKIYGTLSVTKITTLLDSLYVTGLVSVTGNITVSGNISATNFSGSSSGTNTGDQTNISGNSATTSQRDFSGDISTSGQGRFAGWYTGNAQTGIAAEIGMSGGQGYVFVYNRQTSTYGTLNIAASGANLQISGSTINANSGTLQQGGNAVIHAGNIGSQSVSFATTAGSAPNASNLNSAYGVTAGAGNGLKFWNGSDAYKIHMGNSSEYRYGPVTDYSIKTTIDSNGSTRGFTWGINGGTPIAALNVGTGNMQIAGTFTASNFSGTSSGTNTGDQTTISGNAGSATVLQTARTLTIGATGKTFNGSANVSWTLAEIGAQAAGSYATTGYVDTAIANLVDTAPDALNTLNELAVALGEDPNFATTVTNSIGTKAPLASPALTGTPTAPTAATATNTTQIATTAYVKAQGYLTSVTNISGNAGTATTLATARTLTIGSTGKTFNGSANVSWTLAEIGAQAAGSYAAASHTHTIANVTGLQTALDGKQAAGSYAAASHTHGASAITQGTFSAGRYIFPYQSGVTGASAPSYSNGGLELYTDSNHVPTLSFHRGGQSATALYEYDGQLYVKPWTTRAQEGLLLSSGNIGAYAAAVSHTHTIANVTGLQTALDGKQASGSYAAASHTHDDRYYTETEIGNFLGGGSAINSQHVRTSNYRTITGVGSLYSGGTAGWYRAAQITLTSNCGGAVLYGTLYDHRYDGADAYQISVVARSECDFTSNNESHYINVGCTILGSTAYNNYRDKIRVLLVASSTSSRTYELQFYETPWNNDTWQLETTGWTIYTSAQSPGTSTGTARVNYISNQNADYQRANTATYSPIYYDTDTNYYLDPNNNSRLVNLGLGGVTPDVRLSVSGDSHVSGYIYQGGTAGSASSWGSRILTSGGNYTANARSFRFDNVGYGATWAMSVDESGNFGVTGTLSASGYNKSNWDTAFGWGNHAGLYAAASHNHTYNVNDSWLRDNGDNANVKLYGNSRQMVFRTDGTTEYASGVGGYAFAWMYGGDAAANRRMLLNSDGRIWSNYHGWLDDAFQARGSYAAASHTHAISEVTGLQTALDGKQAAGSYAAASHTHTIANVTGLQAALDGKQAAGSYAAASHTHTIANVTGLQAALDGKQAAGSYAAASHEHDRTFITDSRGAARAPSYYDDRYAQWDFQNTSDTGAGGDGWHGLLTVSKWTVYDGSHRQEQLAFTGDDLKRRTASSDSAWGAWKTILDSTNFSTWAAAASHTHAISEVTGLQAALDGKQAAGSYLTTSGKAADSNLLDGLDLHTGRNNEANKVVRTDANGYIQAGWINTTSGDRGTTAPTRIYASNDEYVRFYTPANFISVLGLITTGNIGSQSVNYASSAGTADNIDGRGFRNTGSNDATNADTIESNGITYYTGGVTNFSGNASDGALYSQAYSSSWQHQIAGDYRSGQIALRGKNSGTWQAWRTVLDSSNFTSWAQEKENQRLSTSSTPTFNGVYTNDWFRANGSTGLYFQTYGYGLRAPEAEGNTYGNVATYGIGRGGWSGYGIGSQYVIMGRVGSDVGLHDNNYGWGWYWQSGNRSLGIGESTTSASYRLYVTGAIYATSDIVAYSDRRKKTNIETIPGALDTVLKMRGVFYDRLDETGQGRQLGVIAQEVEAVLPEAVSYAADLDEYGVKYGNIVGLLIEAIKEQQAQIDDLKKRLGE